MAKMGGANEEDASSDTTARTQSLARHETKVVNILRISVLTLLLVTAVIVSSGVFVYTKKQEEQKFVEHFGDDAFQVLEAFHQRVERSLWALDAMSTSITSVAKATNQKFPLVTIPDFELRGSNFRIESGSHIIHWMPLVTDDTRGQWEKYAMDNRFQIDDAFERDALFRSIQDNYYGLKTPHQRSKRKLEENRTNTVLNDGTGFHPKIWSNGALDTLGDEPDGAGPYLPLWQRSPVDASKQSILNMNFARTNALDGVLENILNHRTAAVGPVSIPIPATRARLEANLKISQYREHVQDFIDDLSTFLAYPVFDSFDGDREVGGVLATNIYWKLLFTDLLPSSSRGIICVVENSYNQTFTYRLDGPIATFLGMHDAHESKYDNLGFSADISMYINDHAGPQNRAYTAVSFGDETGKYTIRVYPSDETAEQFETNAPVLYIIIMVCAFAFTSTVFILYSCVVEKRQHIMMKTAVESAQRAADDERDLNEFISHEVRNPLSAAMSACSFVSSAVEAPDILTKAETLQSVSEDIEVMNSSLHYINDFLRSMLDIQHANCKSLKLHVSPTDILLDVLQPVSTMIYKRGMNFEMILECSENLIIMTDRLRLKQVILNLVRNSSKFVEHGFIRMRAAVVEGNARIFVEDSGPGIPPDKRSMLFAKFQTSLDRLSQGTGVGLCLSKTLMSAMGGDLRLDVTYDSGIDGCPGARFIVDLNTGPINVPLSGQVSEELTDRTLECSHTYVDVDHEESGNKSSVELPEELSILFVDDDVVLRKLFVRAVRKIGPKWKVKEASNGEVAIQLCQTECFDLIFLDQYMASVDKQLLGTETAQVMRNTGVKSKICGLSANDLERNFLSAGADHFLLKPLPCASGELRNLIIRILT